MPSKETTGVMSKIVLIIENDSTVEVFKVMLQCFLFTSSHKGVPQSKKSTKKKFRSSSIFKKEYIYIYFQSFFVNLDSHRGYAYVRSENKFP